MNNLINFLATTECGSSSSDKLLICVIILLFITIIWTILIGVMFKLNERRYYYNHVLKNGDNDFDGRYILDEDKKETTIVAKKVTTESPKKTTKTKKTKKIVRVSSNKEIETYVKIRFLKSDKKVIYVAPKGVTLNTGDRIKVRVDNDTVRTAVVVKGNYTRKVYKNNDTYKTLELSD